jgi:hypothetical protein
VSDSKDIAVLALCWSLASACALDDRLVSAGDGGEVAEVHADEILVDNFEDAPQYSRDPRFQRLWQRYAYGAPPIAFHAERVESGAGSNWAFELAWQLQAPGGADASGIGIVSPVLPEVRHIDLSGYSRVVLSHSFSAGTGCSLPQRFIIGVGCSGLDAALEGRVEAAPGGHTGTLLFADLARVDYPPEATGLPPTSDSPSAAQCLAQADEIRIQVALDLAGGACQQGTLRIDDLNIR